ncbi:hypothetical protein [Kocuria sp. ZOR0020]|uniref:hypothetical protein n=1 Tax=Kocuria sp. ZOR0020 TaxID=1339234 RepID=UPI0012E00701|nr:hypothetical protein [Kocuria sp. ZOR0020]
MNSRIDLDEPWEPPSFGDIFIGRIVLDIFTYGLPLIALGLLLPFLLPLERLGFLVCAGLVVALVLVQTLVGSLVFAHFTRVQRHPSPGGVGLLLVDLVIAAASGVLVGGLLATPGAWNGPWAFSLGALALFVAVGHALLWDKQWKQGMAHAQIRRKVSETQAMTDEFLRENRK